MVSNITFAHRGGQIFASGVEFSSSGSNYYAKADHEVLLCCGSIQSPQILELSGVGSKEILDPLGIDVIVVNANVGENFQDHGIVPLSFQAAEGVTTFDSLIAVAGAEAAATTEFFATQTGLLSSLVDSNANLSSQQVDQRTGHVSTESISELTKAAVIDAAPNLKKQYKLLGDALLNPKDSAYQMIYIPIGIQKGFADGEGFISLYTSISRPYSWQCAYHVERPNRRSSHRSELPLPPPRCRGFQ
jgi:choline dehydrogenase